MKITLFWRVFLGYAVAMLVTIAVLALTMVTLVRSERQQAYETEVRVQARDVAQLLQVRDITALWRRDATLNTALNLKLADLRDTYGADVWLVMGNEVLMLSNPSTGVKRPDDPVVLEQIRRVLAGSEIRAQGLFSELGDSVVTIGVPWTAADGGVAGAVLMHVSVDALTANYSDILRYACVAGALAMALGCLLAYWIAKRQTSPIKRISDAVEGYAAGDFSTRIEVVGSDELARLAESVNRMAEDLSNLEDSRKAFVASVSHELRSPLTCIQGYLQGMLDGTITDGERDTYITVVLSESKRLSKLVGDLLQLSRAEAGNLKLNESAFDINELLLSTLFKYEGQINDRGIAVNIAFKDQPLFVWADMDRISQVVANLVDNAVKYASSELKVAAYATGDVCRVTLENDGPGIPAGDLPFIFDRFYTVDKAHTSGKGTGLGLSIVKKILEQHGQSIAATSSAGKTAFSFTLRRVDEPPRAQQAIPAPTDDPNRSE